MDGVIHFIQSVRHLSDPRLHPTAAGAVSPAAARAVLAAGAGTAADAAAGTAAGTAAGPSEQAAHVPLDRSAAGSALPPAIVASPQEGAGSGRP